MLLQRGEGTEMLDTVSSQLGTFMLFRTTVGYTYTMIRLADLEFF